MRKIASFLVSSLACALLASCGSLQLSENAKDLRSRMTIRQAESLLGGYVRPSATRGGLCLVGGGAMTHLDYAAPVRIFEFVVGFSAFYGDGESASPTQHASFSLDARDLREIQVLETDARLTERCRFYKPGYAVVLRPHQKKGLPEQTEVTVNAVSQADLDWILAALTTLSPQVRLSGG